jgi:hypothetical protein
MDGIRLRLVAHQDLRFGISNTHFSSHGFAVAASIQANSVFSTSEIRAAARDISRFSQSRAGVSDDTRFTSLGRGLFPPASFVLNMNDIQK